MPQSNEQIEQKERFDEIANQMREFLEGIEVSTHYLDQMEDLICDVLEVPAPE